MVKGISRRVVVVKAPIGSIFDEAIFIMRDDCSSADGIDAEKILREACSAADEYVKANCKRRGPLLKSPLFLTAMIAIAIISLIALVFFLF